MAAELDMAPPFGLTGARRVFAIALAGVALTTLFLISGFPYDRLAPRAAAALEAATGARVAIGGLGLGVGWFAPQLRATDVDVAWPGGPHLSFERVRVQPAWSLAWLRGRPALALALRSKLGELDGTAVLGSEPAFRGELRQVALALLPIQSAAAGAQLDGLADAQIDLQLAQAGALGTIRFEAKKGSVTLPVLPIGVPFDSLKGDLALGGASLAALNAFDLAGPLVSLSASGTVAHGPTRELSPLALKAHIEAKEPALRSMLQSQGVFLDANGGASVDVGGTLGSPDVKAARPAGRAG